MKAKLLLVFLILTQFVFAQPANDECVNATPIAVSTTNLNISFTINTAAVNNEVGCSGTSAADYVDVWYDFTMPVTGNLFIDGSINWNNFAIYDACGGVEVACVNNSGLIDGLVSGASYKLRVFRNTSTANNTSYVGFSIQAFEVPPNDTCANATPITVSTTNLNVPFSIGGSTINNEVGCSGTSATDYLDIWYDFTMPVTGNIYINGAINWNNFAIYDACGGAEVACVNKNGLIDGLVSGANYRLRVFRTRNIASTTLYTDFDIQAFEVPSNDACTNSIPITVSTTNLNVPFSIGGATINNEVGCSGTSATDYLDVWYDFTMPVTGNIYINGVINWNNFAIYDACGGSEVGCINKNGLISGLISGANYKLRVFRTKSIASTTLYTNFNIYAIGAAINDECSSPLMLTLGNTLTTTNEFSTTSVQVPSCNDLNRADVWYQINSGTATSFDITVGSNGFFQLWEGACGALTQLPNSCFAYTAQDIPVLSNTTYYIQVWTDSLAARTTGTFDIVVADGVLSVFDNDLIEGFSIYPNPVNNVLHLKAQDTIESAAVFNVLGQQVMIINPNNLQTEISMESLKSGVYFIKVKVANQIATYKVVKQ